MAETGIKSFEGLERALGELMLEKGTGPFHEEINYYNVLGLVNSLKAGFRKRFCKKEFVALSYDEAKNIFQDAFNKYWQPFKLTEECLQLSTDELDIILYAWDVGKFCNCNTTRGIEERELPYPLLNAEACYWCTFAAGIMLLRYSKLVEELRRLLEGEGEGKRGEKGVSGDGD